MQRRVAYGALGIGGIWIAIVAVIHFIEKSGVTLPTLGIWHLFLLLACIALYFIPSIVANNRRIKNGTGVILLNFLLGWTLIGWVAALIWAASGETEAEARSKQVNYQMLAAAMRTPAAPPPPPRA